MYGLLVLHCIRSGGRQAPQYLVDCSGKFGIAIAPCGISRHNEVEARPRDLGLYDDGKAAFGTGHVLHFFLGLYG
jgi:hypothetical protein